MGTTSSRSIRESAGFRHVASSADRHIPADYEDSLMQQSSVP